MNPRTANIPPVFFLAAWGCSASIGASELKDAVVEPLLDGTVTAARSAGPHGAVVGRDDGLWWLATGEAPARVDADAGAPVAAAAFAGSVFVLTPSALAVLSGDHLSRPPLADAFDGVPLELSAAGDTLWVRTEGGVSMVRGGVLHGVDVSDRALTGPLTAATVVDGVPMAWIGAGDRLVAIDAGGGLWEDRALTATSLAASVDAIWVIDSGDLVRIDPDGQARRHRLPEDALEVAANPAAHTAWVRTAAAVYAVTADGPTTAGRVDGITDGIATDALGRALLWDRAGLRRVTAGRVVEVVGLEDGDVVNDAVTVTVWPTAPDEVTAVALTIDDVPVAVAAIDGRWTARVAAADWVGATRVLVAQATYPGVVARSAPVRFTAGALGDVTWKDHVGPLYAENCAVCHAGDTATVFADAAGFQARVEDILIEVEAGRMPLGRDPLNESQIELIRAWRDGGFLP